MREIKIDFTAPNPYVDGSTVGRIGEHNATTLVITPPAEMTESEDVASYMVAFKSASKMICSETLEKTDTVEVTLWQQVMGYRNLQMQLVAVSAGGDVIAKSDKLTLTLDESVDGTLVDRDGKPYGIEAEVGKILAYVESIERMLTDLDDQIGTGVIS